MPKPLYIWDIFNPVANNPLRKIKGLTSLKGVYVDLFGVIRRINGISVINGDSSQIHVSWTIFLPVLNQSIIGEVIGPLQQW